MTNFDVIAMALKAGFKEHNDMIYVTTINDDCAKELKAFAALVASLVRADEREACAKVCEDDSLSIEYGERSKYRQLIAAAIRARGATHEDRN